MAKIVILIAVLMTIGVYGLVAAIVKLDDAGLYLVETLRDLDAALEVLAGSRIVKWAGPDVVVRVADLPTDPRLDDLWGLTG